VEEIIWREQCGGNHVDVEGANVHGQKPSSQIHRSVNSATGNNCTDTDVMCDWFSGDHSNCRYYSSVKTAAMLQ
jgi:hypothetical protein